MKLRSPRTWTRFAALAAMAALVLTWTTLARSQDDEITIESDALGAHQRPLVAFPHARHAEQVDCKICHHDYDELGGNTGSEGMACADCHAAEADDGKPPLMKAFHLGCKGCHRKRAAMTGESLPVMCGHCHRR